MVVNKNNLEIIMVRDQIRSSYPYGNIRFTLPIDSDHLFYKLHELYPNIEGHEQRKVQALVDFLQWERSQEDSFEASAPSPSFSGSESALTAGSDHERRSSSSSSASPPPTSNHIRGWSALSHNGGLSVSKASSGPSRQPPKGEVNPLGIITFDAKSLKPVKQPEPRRLSEEQRIRVKKIRKVGACTKHRKQKKGCNCVQTEDLAEGAQQEASSAPRAKRKPFQSPEPDDVKLAKRVKKEGAPDTVVSATSFPTGGQDPLFGYVINGQSENVSGPPLPGMPFHQSDNIANPGYDYPEGELDCSVPSPSRDHSFYSFSVGDPETALQNMDPGFLPYFLPNGSGNG